MKPYLFFVLRSLQKPLLIPHKGLGLSALWLALALTGCGRESESELPPAAPPVSREIRLLSDTEFARAETTAREQLRLVTAEGVEVKLWATEKLLGDPVAIDVDHYGRVWATVTHRSNNSEFDIRGYPTWEFPSVTFTNVEDRRRFLRETLAPEKSAQNIWLTDHNQDGSHDWRDLAVVQEEVVLLQDTSGKGRADTAAVFLRDFNDEVTDVLGGIFYHHQEDELYLAVGPDAWRVKDTNGDGVADRKISLAHGFAVHIGFSGHGMSGITQGPDGRIYYGIGDIGMSVTDAKGKRWHYPNQGVVVRSEPDGSNFEVFAHGVRNTHEFAFDEYGNLISVDNDGDHEGEYERLVYLIDGSDSGWRIHWQLGKYKDPLNNTYKVWMDEHYYQPHFKDQSALILPPIAPYRSGPAGMVYNPGTALSDEWKNHFFVVEFVGSAPQSGINAFSLKPKGASFELVSDRPLFRGIQGTGLSFGPEGALYMSDWIEGWGRNGKGRIWTLDTPATEDSDQRLETRARLVEDFTAHAPEQLFHLLRHPDLRVRQKAQFELVAREAIGPLETAVAQQEHRLARIHGLWGLGQLARQKAEVGKRLLLWLADEDAEIRAQAAKLLGDAPIAVADQLLPLLQDGEARVRFFAAQALGRIGDPKAVAPLVAMLAANNDEDVYLRQAGAIALARIGDEQALSALIDHPSEAVRVAAVIALGRLKSPALGQFLDDTSEFVVTNAARAINDEEFVTSALPALANLLGQTRFSSEPLLRRAINANLYVGGAASAARLGAVVERTALPASLRAEAINTLSVWGEASVFDRVTGFHRGPHAQDPGVARATLKPLYQRWLTDKEPLVREATVRALGRLQLSETAPEMTEVLRRDPAPAVRVAALASLHQLAYSAMGDAVFTAMNDQDQRVRMTALGLLPTLNLPAQQVVEMHRILLQQGSVGEQQAAFKSLANVDAPEARQVFTDYLQALRAGKIAPAVQLDLIAAVEKLGTPELLALLQDYEHSKDKTDPLQMYGEALYGGDAIAGMHLFRYSNTAQCVRCHRVGHRGNPVGPELTGIANILNRQQLLEALVAPAARIAPGFGRVSVVLKNGQKIEGFFERESATTMTLVTADKSIEVVKADVVRTEPGISGMPPMGLLLTKAQLRDLVEYLVTLTGEDELEAH